MDKPLMTIISWNHQVVPLNDVIPRDEGHRRWTDCLDVLTACSQFRLCYWLLNCIHFTTNCSHLLESVVYTSKLNDYKNWRWTHWYWSWKAIPSMSTCLQTPINDHVCPLVHDLTTTKHLFMWTSVQPSFHQHSKFSAKVWFAHNFHFEQHKIEENLRDVAFLKSSTGFFFERKKLKKISNPKHTITVYKKKKNYDSLGKGVIVEN